MPRRSIIMQYLEENEKKLNSYNQAVEGYNAEAEKRNANYNAQVEQQNANLQALQNPGFGQNSGAYVVEMDDGRYGVVYSKASGGWGSMGEHKIEPIGFDKKTGEISPEYVAYGVYDSIEDLNAAYAEAMKGYVAPEVDMNNLGSINAETMYKNAPKETKEQWVRNPDGTVTRYSPQAKETYVDAAGNPIDTKGWTYQEAGWSTPTPTNPVENNTEGAWFGENQTPTPVYTPGSWVAPSDYKNPNDLGDGWYLTESGRRTRDASQMAAAPTPDYLQQVRRTSTGIEWVPSGGSYQTAGIVGKAPTAPPSPDEPEFYTLSRREKLELANPTQDAAGVQLATTYGLPAKTELANQASGGQSVFADRDKQKAIEESGILARVLSGQIA